MTLAVRLRCRNSTKLVRYAITYQIQIRTYLIAPSMQFHNQEALRLNLLYEFKRSLDIVTPFQLTHSVHEKRSGFLKQRHEIGAAYVDCHTLFARCVFTLLAIRQQPTVVG